MTNEQLKILLENQAALLRIAIEKAVELMPEGAEMKKEKKSIFAFPVYALIDTERHTALIPLYDHLESIERQVIELGAVYLTTGADICKAREKWDNL